MARRNGGGYVEVYAGRQSAVGVHVYGVGGIFTADGQGNGAGQGVVEAASGGPIGLVQEGDQIAIDIPNASVQLLVSDEELATRKAVYVQPKPNITTGWLSRYARMVTSADEGAVLR